MHAHGGAADDVRGADGYAAAALHDGSGLDGPDSICGCGNIYDRGTLVPDRSRPAVRSAAAVQADSDEVYPDASLE